MENLGKTVLALAEDNFSKPMAGIHRLGIHFASTFVALLAVTLDKNKAVAFQIIENQDVIHEFDDSILRKLLNNFKNNHSWFTDTAVDATFLLPGNGLTLVPEEIYNSFTKEQLLEPQYLVLSNEMVYAEKLISAPVMAVYAFPLVWNQLVKSCFSSAKISHEDVPWLNHLLSAQNKNISDPSVLVYLEENKLKIQLVKNSKLLYYNSFYYQENLDILYYLQLALTQSGLTLSNTNILLAGSLSGSQTIQDSLRPYAASVIQLKLPFFTEIPSSIRKVNPALYLSLFSLITCG